MQEGRLVMLSDKTKKVFRIAFFVFVIGTMGMFWYDEIVYYFFEDYEEYAEACPEGSNVAVVKIRGDIVGYSVEYEYEYVHTSAETFVETINQINQNDNIKAIIVEIDSWGGEPVAAEDMFNALRRTEKPTVAVMKGIGASAAYAIAVGADRIYASRLSDIGSIGVTMSYLDYSEQNKKEGITFQQLSSGKFKDTGDMDKALTEEERELLMKDIMKLHEIFVEMVAENRNLHIEDVAKLADGSTMMGEDAKEAGLIDEIGGLEDAKQYLREEFSIEPVLCIYDEAAF